MNAILTCPACGHTQPMSEGILGRKVRCPRCRAVFRVNTSELSAPLDLGQPATTGSGKRAHLPAWAYAPLGFGAALLLIGVIVLARSFRGSAPSQLAKPAGEGPHAAAPPVLGQSPPKPKAQISASPQPTVTQAEGNGRARRPGGRVPRASGEPPVPRADGKVSQEEPNTLQRARGKKAIALVTVKSPDREARGTAFCIDKSGLFVTNARVVQKVVDGRGDLVLLINIGLDTERSLAATVQRVDDYLDLALLKIDAVPSLTALEFGKDESLSETSPVLTFGIPIEQPPSPETAASTARFAQQFGRTVTSGRITTLHGPREHLDGVQFDGQIDPGQFGGPVIDTAGKVIGVAVDTIPRRSMNLAVPVGRLSDFMAAPGVSFHPPALSYEDRSKPVSWSIKLEPATAGGKLPEGLSVYVTIAHGKDDRRTRQAKPARDGSFEVEVTPVPSDPPTPVRALEAVVEAKQGKVVLATVHRRIELAGAPAPPVVAAKDKREPEIFIIRILPRPPMFGGFGPRIPGPGGFGPRIPGPGGLGPRVPGLRGLGPRVRGSGGPRDYVVVVPRTPPIIPQGPSDEGMLTVISTLNVNGQANGARNAIRPPQALCRLDVAMAVRHTQGAK